jgi:TonB family protein
MSYRALLFCADEKTAPVVARILSELEFAVESCREPLAAVKLLAADHFEALVVDCDDEQNAALLLKSAHHSELNHSSLAVALVEGQAGIARAFRLGANLVLAKPINVEQSKGTLRVARGLLRKAEAAKPAAAALSPAAILPPSATPADSLCAPAAVEAAANLTLAAVPAASVPDQMVDTFSPVAHAPLKLEVEADPVPPLGAEERALLESLPAPLAPPPPVASAGAKAYAWQPSSKSLPEPAAAPAAAAPPSFSVPAKTSGLPPASDRALPSPAAENQPETGAQKTGGLEARGLFSGPNAATAATPAKEVAAPAKEIPAPVLDLYETKPIPPPTRVAGAAASKKGGERKSAAAPPKSLARSRGASASNAFSPDEEEAAPAPAGEESNTKNLIIAAVLVLGLAASGYYAWPRLQPLLESLPIVQKYLGAPQSAVSPRLSPAVPAVPPAPASAATASAAGPEQPPSASASGPVEHPATPAESSRAVASPEPEPAASASASAAAAGPGPRASIAHPAAGRAAKPILVKDDRNQNSALRSAQPAAPAPLAIASSSGDQAIAGIVGTIAAAHPVLKPINVSQGVSNGLLVKRVPPLYPTLALQMRVAGTVELQANISKDGSTANVQVLKGDPLLRQAAVNAVRQWKYKPYRLDGQPVDIVTQVTVNFVLPQ